MEDKGYNFPSNILSKGNNPMTKKQRQEILNWALDLLIAGNTEAAYELVQLVKNEDK